jgi:hypothetical protein
MRHIERLIRKLGNQSSLYLHNNEEVIKTVESTNIKILNKYIMDRPLGMCHQHLSHE